MTTRIGVVADTHCPEFADRLPSRLGEVLGGVDLILHAGDINQASTLTELELIAPVAAVRGDHDSSLASLPRSREVTVGGKKIVVVHGDRSRWVEEPQTLLWTFSLGYFHPHAGLARSLRRRFPSADVIIFGHTHRAHAEVIDGTLLFNPGGVHQWNPATAARRLVQRPGWFEWCWLQVARHLRSFPGPSVGILEIGDEGVASKVVPL
ncbi:MAG TPA: metallophosphoesterase family protein [Candidatus Dormibacteraeota bacterium]|nr:metallophosphoesterase family protein [Candidatus Dormibacteraeota bacterium]